MKMKTDLKNSWILKTHYRLLKEIDNGGQNKSCHHLARTTNMAYSHVHRVMKSFRALGLVNRNRLDGRAFGISLTVKGKRVLDYLNEVQRELELE